MHKRKKLLIGISLSLGALIIPIGSVSGVLVSKSQVDSTTQNSNSSNTQQVVVKDNYVINLNAVKNNGFDLSKPNDANLFASQMARYWNMFLSNVVNVSQSEINKTVKNVSISYEYLNNAPKTAIAHITLKSGYVWDNGSQNKNFTSYIIKTEIKTDYSLDIASIVNAGYNLNSDSAADAFILALRNNYYNLLPKIVKNKSEVSTTNIKQTIKWISLSYTHDGSRINSITIRINLNEGYLWANGSQSKDFKTNIVAQAISTDYSLDIASIVNVGYNLNSDSAADAFILALRNNYYNLLPKIVKNKSEVSTANIKQTIKWISLSYTHKGSHINSITIRINLNEGYAWANGLRIKDFVTSVTPATVVKDHFNIGLNEVKAAGYNMDSDAAANKFAADVKNNFNTLLPSLINYKGQHISKGRVNEIVKSVYFSFFHDGNRISAFRLHVTLKNGYVWNDGNATQYFTTQRPKQIVVVKDHYNLNMQKVLADGYTFNNKNDTLFFAQSMELFWSDLLPEYSFYQGNSVSAKEVKLTVKSVRIEYRRSIVRLYGSVVVYVTLNDGYVWGNGSNVEHFTTGM